MAKNASEIEKKNIRASCQKNLSCGGKGVISYEKIKIHQDQESIPENDFFSKTEFYSSLKNEIIDDEGYENVIKFWKL